MWTGDTLHGPVIGGKKSYLFAFIDDHSRAVMGARWSHHDDVVRMAAAFRPALQARGVPQSAYLDNGSPFVDAWLLDRIEVRLAGKPAGTAVPVAVGRHRHPKTRTPDGQARTEPAPTGIDYLSALGDGHDEALREQVSYRFLIGGPQEPAKQEEQEDPEEKEGNGRD